MFHLGQIIIIIYSTVIIVKHDCAVAIGWIYASSQYLHIFSYAQNLRLHNKL